MILAHKIGSTSGKRFLDTSSNVKSFSLLVCQILPLAHSRKWLSDIMDITLYDLPFFGKVMLPNIKSLGCIVNILKENMIKSNELPRSKLRGIKSLYKE